MIGTGIKRAAAIGLIVASAQVAAISPAGAWLSANRWGGSTSHSWGETSRTNAFGGSSSRVWGEGYEHTNRWGGSTSHAWNGGTSHTNVYGGSTYGAYGAGVAHTYPGGGTAYRPPGAYVGPRPYYPAYHPPVAVPYYGGGCYGCAAAAGAVVGAAAVGAAAATAGAVAAASAYRMGMQYATLPAGCAMQPVGPTTYYACGGTWFLPSYGANGVYYRVVPAP